MSRTPAPVDSVLAALVETTPHACAQAAACTHPSLVPFLAVNPHLAAGVWQTLWASRPDATTVEGLLARELTAEQVDAVITRERRLGALKSLVGHCTLTAHQGTALLATGKVTCDIARTWLHSGRMPHELWPQVSAIAGAEAQIRYIAGSPQIADADAVASAGRASFTCTPAVGRLITARPHLLGAVIATGNAYARTAAAESRHLLDGPDLEALLAGVLAAPSHEQGATLAALVTNPNCPRRVLEQLAARYHPGANVSFGGGAHLRRRLTEGRADITVPWEELTDERLQAVVVAAAIEAVHLRADVRAMPWLSDRDRERLAMFRPSAAGDPGAALDDEDALAAMLPLSGTRHAAAVARVIDSRMPGDDPQAWQAVFTLLLDHYDGSVGDLIAVASLL